MALLTSIYLSNHLNKKLTFFQYRLYVHWLNWLVLSSLERVYYTPLNTPLITGQ
jgi:hypothetical protein